MGLRQWAGSQDEEDHEALYTQSIAENVLETAEDRVGKLGMTPITKRIEHGDPATEIIATAQDEEVKALVLGTRGLTSFKGIVMGSVAQKVSHNAKCTVITVK